MAFILLIDMATSHTQDVMTDMPVPEIIVGVLQQEEIIIEDILTTDMTDMTGKSRYKGLKMYVNIFFQIARYTFNPHSYL